MMVYCQRGHNTLLEQYSINQLKIITKQPRPSDVEIECIVHCQLAVLELQGLGYKGRKNKSMLTTAPSPSQHIILLHSQLCHQSLSPQPPPLPLRPLHTPIPLVSLWRLRILSPSEEAGTPLCRWRCSLFEERVLSSDAGRGCHGASMYRVWVEFARDRVLWTLVWREPLRWRLLSRSELYCRRWPGTYETGDGDARYCD